MITVMIRRATVQDAEACHTVMWTSVTDFGARRGTPLQGTASEWWERGQALQRLLMELAAEWWVAEEKGVIIGYARTIARGGLVELTEFFVIPTRQSAGVGRALLDRAFPIGLGDVRSIIATTDARALASYYRAGTAARFPLLTLTGVPHRAEVASDWTARVFDVASAADREALRQIEQDVLEHPRGDRELKWLAENREAHLFDRRGETIGFAFVGAGGAGPIVARNAADLPAILLHVEERASLLGVETLELQVPGPNEMATRHLLGRGFRVDPWVNVLMSNRPFGQFDRVIPFGPPVFL